MDDFELAKQYFIDGLRLTSNEEYLNAESKFMLSLEVLPDRVSTLTNLAATQIKLKKYFDAMENAKKALYFDPVNVEANLNLGIIECELKNFSKAIDFFNRTLDLMPASYESWLNKGNALQNLNQHHEALVCFSKAIEIKPNLAEAWVSKGLTFLELNNCIDSKAAFEKAISLDPNHKNARYCIAFVQLLTGNYKEGWKNYEFRSKQKNESFKVADVPMLQSLKKIENKNIYIFCDQFFGDSIQFSRYIKKLSNFNANFYIEVDAPLKDLFKNSFLNCIILEPDNKIPHIDYQVPISSLPLLFDENFYELSSCISYLSCTSQAKLNWSKKLNLSKNKLNIALACSGNIDHFKNDKNRPIRLELFKPLLALADIYLVQKNLETEDEKFLSNHVDIKFLGNEIESFDDSAAIIQQMDLVISIDTSIAHLSGALGKKTWVLLSCAPDWRWMLDREDSPWYPSVKLYRQKNFNDWEGVLQKMMTDLRAIAR
jgi:tetratricopeptide (TPR) repeat protein